MFEFIKNKKFKKLLFLLSLAAAIIAISFYIPNLWKSKQVPTPTSQIQTTTEYEFSQSDDRKEEIKGKIITLKRLKPEYFKDYYQMSSPPIVRGPLYFPKNYTFEWTKKFLEKELKKESTGQVLLYMIFDNKENKLIGSAEIREKNQTDPGQMACWLNDKYWGEGRIQEALDLISKEYFRIKDADSYNAHVEMWNLRSYYALKKCGFEIVDFYYENGQPSRYILEYYNPNKKHK